MQVTSLASHFEPLQASPAGLLSHFAPSKFSKIKSVSQSTPNGLRRIKIQKKFFTPLTRFAQPYLPLRSLRSLGLCASRSHSQSLRSIRLWPSRSRFLVASFPRASRSLPTPCHSQGPKECPCQVSYQLDQNCGR